jgi:hypothetical protein
MLGTKSGRKSEISEGVETAVRHQRYAATTSAIATVWTAEGYEFLAPEAAGTISAVTGFDADTGFIDKFHGGWDLKSLGR